MKRYVVSIILCAGLQISSLAQQPAPVAVVISSPNQVVKVGSEIRVDITVSNVTTQSVSIIGPANLMTVKLRRVTIFRYLMRMAKSFRAWMGQ